jgi:predicted lysophospholipase L1 biosynthesis ABC-type transport system permease subunit
VPRVKQATLDLLKKRHEGEADVTVIAQDAILATFDRLLTALTLAVGGIAAISLGVAGVLIMNVMLVSVAQRRSEIGLLKALGASGRQVRSLFMVEAGLISALGAIGGVILGLTASFALGRIYPQLPIVPPLWAVAAAVATALGRRPAVRLAAGAAGGEAGRSVVAGEEMTQMNRINNPSRRSELARDSHRRIASKLAPTGHFRCALPT